MKTIYIEGLGLVDGHFSGIGQYILGILKGLDALADEAKYNSLPFPDIIVIIPRDKVNRFKSFGFRHIRYRIFPLSFRNMSALWHRGKMLPLDIFYGKGVYIFPRFVSMPLLFNKSVLVIYDLSYELYKQYSDEGNANFLSKGVKHSIDKATKVITISQNAKKEICTFYDLGSKDVSVATPATDPRIFYRRSQKEITHVKNKYGVKGKYILALSNLEPRKNLDTLIDAYCSLPPKLLREYKLLLVGVNGWKTDKLFEKIIDKVKDGYEIIRPSKYVSDKDKPAIISGASLLVYPSHYEGFGMPPLEALACGVPVITANNSSLPEVVGNEGRMIDSNNVIELAHTVAECLKDIESLTLYAVKKGPKQASRFNWRNSAQQFIDIAKELS